METLKDIGKLLGLLLIKVSHTFMRSSIGTMRPPSIPKTKRPAPPKGQQPKPKPRKYRLVPNSQGTYTLEQLSSDTEMYWPKKVGIKPEEADAIIKNLERDTIYYREKEK